MAEILGFFALLVFGMLGFCVYAAIGVSKKMADPKLENEQELMANQGIWRTTAPFPNVWERVVRSLSMDPVLVNYRWNVQADQAYKEITLTATVDQQHGPLVQATIIGKLKFEPLENGGTIVNYAYTTQTANLQNKNSVCERMKKFTNHRLRTICAELNQDPNKGLPF